MWLALLAPLAHAGSPIGFDGECVEGGEITATVDADAVTYEWMGAEDGAGIAPSPDGSSAVITCPSCDGLEGEQQYQIQVTATYADGTQDWIFAAFTQTCADAPAAGGCATGPARGTVGAVALALLAFALRTTSPLVRRWS